MTETTFRTLNYQSLNNYNETNNIQDIKLPVIKLLVFYLSSPKCLMI